MKMRAHGRECGRRGSDEEVCAKPGSLGGGLALDADRTAENGGASNADER